MRSPSLLRLAVLVVVSGLLWKLNATRPLRPFASVEVEDQVTRIVPGPNGTVVLGYRGASGGGRIEMRAVPSGRTLATHKTQAPVSALALSRDARFLAIATSSLPLGGAPLTEGAVEIWKNVSGSSFGRRQSVLRRDKPGWHFEVSSLAWQTTEASSLPHLAVGGMFYQFKADPKYGTWDWERYAGNAALWDVSKPKVLREQEESIWMENSVDWLAFDARNGQWLGATAGQLQSDIFSANTPKRCRVGQPGLAEVEGLVAADDGEVIVAGGQDRDSSHPQGFYARGLSSGKTPLDLNYEGENLNAVALSNDQSLFAVNSSANDSAKAWNQVLVFDRKTDRRRVTLSEGGIPVWTRDGKFLVAADWNALHFYDAQQF